MKLLWMRYKDRKNHNKVNLFLLLGTKNGTVYLLKASELHHREVIAIRNAMEQLRGLPTEGRIRWLRDNIPNGFKKGYRTISQAKVNIVQTYDAKGIQR